MREKMLKEKNNGGLSIHFGHDKTFSQLSSLYFWLGMLSNVKKFVERCRVCQHAKGKRQNTRLYQSLPIPNKPWASVRMDFLLGFIRTQQGNDSIYVVVDRF
jgi:hypothetical protein